ncbi:MAG: 2'-5' RNA ligase family protein [Chloroflexi bacterium]|nr:2'-5' RNA ligase family protein [Chloroflexota bacterium]
MLSQNPTTIPSEIRDFPEWHHGRKKYAVWVLQFDENLAVREKFNAAKKHLKDYLLEPYYRQPHITLFVCGFLSEKHHYNDDFTQAQLDAQIQALSKRDIGPFEIEIGSLNSFASAPFLEIHDPYKGIPRLREVLRSGAREFRTAPYRPHLTIGLYADAFPSKKVLDQIATYENIPIRWAVKKITLAIYQAEEVVGKLDYRFDYLLKT